MTSKVQYFATIKFLPADHTYKHQRFYSKLHVIEDIQKLASAWNTNIIFVILVKKRAEIAIAVKNICNCKYSKYS